MGTFCKSQCQDGDENFRALKDALENLNTQEQSRAEHIKKDSNRNFVKKFCSLFLGCMGPLFP